MRIALIYPYFLEPRVHADEIAAVPLGLYYVAAALKAAGHCVAVHNWHALDPAPQAVGAALKTVDAQILGFSIVHANRWGAIEIARLAKAGDPRLKIVFGGIGATFLWRHLMNEQAVIDFIIRGEGEAAMVALAQALADEAADFSMVPNLVWRTAAGVVSNPMAPPLRDLDSLPPPARDFDFQHLALTRGCPGRCTFCGSPRFWGRRVRSHSTAYLLDQLERLTQRGQTFFFLADDTFTLRRQRVIALCRGIVERCLPITWQAISRVNAVDAEMLGWMRRAGCVQISYGVESGAAEIRRRLCKDIDEEQIVRAFTMTVAHGMLARAYFIYGAPGENEATIDATLALIRRIRPLAVIFYVMTLFPGTALYEDYCRRHGVGDEIWRRRIEDLFYYETDPALSREAVLAFGRRLRTTYYRELPQFAERIEMAADDELRPAQADFLSRLALTFSHGDYARLVEPAAGRRAARRLCQQALARHPDARAFWTMALLDQEDGAWENAEKLLLNGLTHHPRHPLLHLRLAVGLMRRGDFRCALEHLAPYAQTADVAPVLAACRRHLAAATGR